MKKIDPEQYAKALWVIIPERGVYRRLMTREAPPIVWVSLVAGLVFFVFMGDIYGWLGVNDMISVAAAGVGRAGHVIELLFRFTVGFTLGGLVPAFLAFGPVSHWMEQLWKRRREHRCARCGYPIDVAVYPPRNACAETTCTECGLHLLIVPAKQKPR
jgi:hypothetical protein